MEALGRVELPTNGLGNRCSIHLSYRAISLVLDFTKGARLAVSESQASTAHLMYRCRISKQLKTGHCLLRDFT
jgi:hypothetical protein